jgi:hypothetical protein
VSRGFHLIDLGILIKRSRRRFKVGYVQVKKKSEEREKVV